MSALADLVYTGTGAKPVTDTCTIWEAWLDDADQGHAPTVHEPTVWEIVTCTCGWRSHPLPHGAAHDVWAGHLRSHRDERKSA